MLISISWFQDFGLEIILVPIKLFNEAAACAEYICPTSHFSFLANAGEGRRGTESQVLLAHVGINYGGALWSKVTVSLYWSNSEQNPAPNLSIDLDREFQKLSKLCRSIVPI